MAACTGMQCTDPDSGEQDRNRLSSNTRRIRPSTLRQHTWCVGKSESKFLHVCSAGIFQWTRLQLLQQHRPALQLSPRVLQVAESLGDSEGRTRWVAKVNSALRKHQTTSAEFLAKAHHAHTYSDMQMVANSQANAA